jgi:cyclic pyranopterin phosphate synthase
MRDGASDTELSEIILKAIERKPKGHDFDHTRLADGAQVVRFMNTTGG